MSKVKKILQSHVFLTLVAIAVAFLVGAIFLVVMGYDPIKIYGTLIEGIFSKPKYLAYSVVYATPLIFVGLAVAFSFKTGVFNIGAEGQFVVGSMAACLVGIFVDAPAIIHVPLCFLAAAAAGAVWGVIVAFMKTKWGINEVLSMIMFNWIAFYLSNYLVTIPAIHSDGTAEATKNIAESAQILLPQSMRSALAPTSNYGILIAIVLVVAVYLILDKTILGYELKAVGYNKNASEYGGISVNRAVYSHGDFRWLGRYGWRCSFDGYGRAYQSVCRSGRFRLRRYQRSIDRCFQSLRCIVERTVLWRFEVWW